MDALASSVRAEFVRRTARHLRHYYPAETKAWDEAGLANLVQKGMVRAAHHGIENQRDVTKYLNLMCEFGADFDTDPALPWAQAILGAAGSQMMQRLCQKAEAVLQRGQDGDS